MPDVIQVTIKDKNGRPVAGFMNKPVRFPLSAFTSANAPYTLEITPNDVFKLDGTLNSAGTLFRFELEDGTGRVELKSAQIGQRIAELVVETLGYYALPCPDELLIDNEGSIGPDHALGASQRWLFSCAGSTRGASADTQKDAIARIALELIGDRVAS